jgi:G3E family GTPase
MGEARGERPAIPLTLLTGFLGAGKTTLLNSLLRDPLLAGTAVIVNEFGEVGIDHLLIETADDGIIELSSGCVCCTVRGELAEALERLLAASERGRVGAIERIVVETTGLADPAPILALLTRRPELRARFAFDGVVTVADAVHGAATLDAHEEAVRQIAVADRIVLAKSDLDPARAQALVRRLRRINPGAPILDRAKGKATPAALFGAGAFDPEAKGADVRRWLAAEAHEEHDHGDHDVSRHDARIASFVLTGGPMAAADLFRFLDRLELGHASKLLRVKGVVAVAEDPERPVVIQAVQGRFSPPATLGGWPDGDRRSRLVVIGRDLDRRAVEALWGAFTGATAADMPDRQAIVDNPLAVAGFTDHAIRRS